MNENSIATFNLLFKTLTDVSDKNDILKSIQQMAEQIDQIGESYTTQNLFNALLSDIANVPTDDTEKQFMELINQLISAFDISGKGDLMSDLNAFKVHPLENILISVAKVAAILSLSDTKLLKTKLTKSNIANIVYRLVLYALFVPLTVKNSNFRDFIKVPENEALLAEVLNLMHTTLISSDVLIAMMDTIVEGTKISFKWIKNLFSKCPCSCFAKPSTTRAINLKADLDVKLLEMKVQSDEYRTLELRMDTI